MRQEEKSIGFLFDFWLLFALRGREMLVEGIEEKTDRESERERDKTA